MNSFSVWLLPLVTVFIVIYGMAKGRDIFSDFLEGARENLNTCAELLPTLVCIVSAVGMFGSSGAAELLTSAVSGICQRVGFPPECVPLALIRPVSGSGALAVYESVLESCHPDSFAGRVASVMLGATETTFYTVAVYYSAAGIKRSRHTVPAALAGDITGFMLSVLTVRLLLVKC